MEDKKTFEELISHWTVKDVDEITVTKLSEEQINARKIEADNFKLNECEALYTVVPKLESCSEVEFKAFINKYPNKLISDFYVDAISYNDFSIAKKWPGSVVAMLYPPMYDDKECLYAIAKNMDKVFASIKEK